MEELKAVCGLVAVVLGGSRARSTRTPQSDVDLGLYYEPDALAHLGADGAHELPAMGAMVLR